MSQKKRTENEVPEQAENVISANSEAAEAAKAEAAEQPEAAKEPNNEAAKTADEAAEAAGQASESEKAEEAKPETAASGGGKRKRKKEKKPLTKEQKKKRTIKALIIVGAIVLALAIIISSIAIANTVSVKALLKNAKSFSRVEYTEQLKPVKDTDGYWTFNTDRELKVMQITDVHIGGGSFSQNKDVWAMNAVATMIRAEKPDLVIVTGDIAFPVPYAAGTFNNLSGTKIFANMMESLGVYWTFVYGNHDTEVYSNYTREEITKYYEGEIESGNFKYCLFERGFADEEELTVGTPNARGYGNNIIKVKNSAGIVTHAFVLLDSHSYIDGDYFGMAWKYDNLHESQINWYTAEMDKLKAANVEKGGADVPVKNTAYFHIPLREYREAWKEFKENDNKDTENVKKIYGNVGESDGTKNGQRTYGVFCGMGTDEFFEQGAAHGLSGVFCGHDHYNNFSIEYKGVRLTYGMSIDYLAYPGIYKEHSQRGCTIITIAEDGTFDCEARNYYRDYQQKPEKGSADDIK